MRRRLHLGQVEQCSVLLKKVRPSTVVSAHLPNVLSAQRSDNLRMKRQSQVTRCVLSYKDVFFSSATVPWENFHCAKMLGFVRKKGTDEGLFEKSYTLLHKRCRIQPLHHLLQDTLLRLAFSTPPIGKGTYLPRQGDGCI